MGLNEIKITNEDKIQLNLGLVISAPVVNYYRLLFAYKTKE